MSESRVNSRGQVTVPKAVRVRLNLKPGDRVVFIVEDDGAVRLRAAKQDISSLRGILPPPKRRATIEEIEEAIARSHGARWRRNDRN
jgi:antitoxin PrlF